jgi:hypothetical protein
MVADAEVHVAAVDAAVERVAAADAAVAVSADASIAQTPAPDATAAKLSIAESAVAGDWQQVLTVCAATPQGLATAELTSCAIAACNLKNRADAVLYAKRVKKADLGPIVRACKANKISLAAPTGRDRPKVPAPDPKIDPCEANPLKCQK